MSVSSVPVFYDETTGKEIRAYTIFIKGKNRNKKIYYARLRNTDGKQLSVHISTGKTDYEEAEKWVIGNYQSIIKKYDRSLGNRNNKEAKQLQRALSDYFKTGSRWLALDKQFGIERRDKGNKEYDSLITRHLIPYLNEHRLFAYADINAQVLYNFQIDCISKGISNKNIQDMIFSLKLLYNRLSMEGVIAYNFFIGITQVRREKSKEKGMFKASDVRGIFGRAWEGNETEYMFHLIACMTGLRNSEIRLLKTEDFEEINGLHFINVTNAREDNSGTKTENGVRKVVLHSFVYDRIRDYIIKNNREKHLFLNGRGNVYSTSEVSEMIQGAAQRIGVGNEYLREHNITFHSWRHLYSTVLYESGQISSDWIEYFMGHKQRGVKAVYTHLHTVDGKDVCGKVLKVLGDNFIKTK
jgi:integrase